MNGSVGIGRVAGAGIRVHWSALLFAGVLAQRLAVARFPNHAAGYSSSEYLLAAVATALAFLASVLAHEVGHALVARRAGIGVDRVAVSLLGGVTEMSTEAASAGAELAVAAAGPLTSLTIGGALTGAGIALRAQGASPLFVQGLVWLGALNLLVAAFNALPGAPLDGGRVLYALVWKRSGDRGRAARAAGRVGGTLGAALVVAGLAELGRGAPLAGALSLAIVGGFLAHGARSEPTGADPRELSPSRPA